MKNEEKFAIAVIACVFAFVAACFAMSIFTGCCTTGAGVEPGRIRESNSYIIGQLDNALEGFDKGIRGAVERSRGIESEIARLDYLFGQYEQAALRLRDEVSALRDEIEHRVESDMDSGEHSASPDSSSDSDNNSRKNP